MTTDKKPPVQNFKDSGLKINLWAQENSKTGKMYVTASLEKSYRTRDGQWRNSKSFSQDDLAKLKPLLEKAEQQMQKWRDYYQEVEKNPDLPNPVQQQEMQQEQASHQQTQTQDMAAQRDAVMAQSEMKGGSQGHEHAQTNIQAYEPSR